MNPKCGKNLELVLRCTKCGYELLYEDIDTAELNENTKTLLKALIKFWEATNNE